MDSRLFRKNIAVRKTEKLNINREPCPVEQYENGDNLYKYF